MERLSANTERKKYENFSGEKPKLYDLSEESHQLAFYESLTNLPSTSFIAPWESKGPAEIMKEAQRKGILVDTVADQADDLAITENKSHYKNNHDDLMQFIERKNAFDNTTMVEFPWRTEARFVRLLNHEDFRSAAFSRNRFIHSDETLKKLQHIKFAIVGMGVGSNIGEHLIRQGAENLLVCDGGDITLHDFNRINGATVAEIGINHAQQWAQRMYELNPYAQLNVSEKNLSQHETEESVGFDTFFNGAEYIIEEADDLLIKYLVRKEAKKRKLPVIMGTDLGVDGLVQIEFPDDPPFNGRLSQSDLDILEEATRQENTLAHEQKTMFAIKLLGQENIPQRYIRALQESSGTAFWPQIKIAADKVGATMSELILQILAEGEESIEKEIRV